MRKTNQRVREHRRRISHRRLFAIGGVACVVLVVILSIDVYNSFAAQTLSNSTKSIAVTGSKGQYWNMPETAIYGKRIATIDSRTFYIGDAVIMPNGLKLQVTRLQHNWQPTSAVAATYGRIKDGDDPSGREVLAVWFQATDVGTSPIVYNDSFFTLQVAGKAEQRVAHISSLLRTAYGDHGANPWLLPGQSTTTFVPFLVTPNVNLMSFQYYIVPDMKQGSNQLPTLTRLVITLQVPQGRVSSTFVFVASKTITVGQ